MAITLGIGATSVLFALTYVVRLRPPKSQLSGKATLLMALTGPATGLLRLLKTIEEQTLKPRRLVIAIESPEDPAFLAAKRAIQTCTFPAEIVIAGPAKRAAQKCTNLLAAMARLDANDDVIVFLDADIVPPPGWLSALVSPIQGEYCDIVTGYRWPMIERPALGAHLLLAIDRPIGLLPRVPWARATWGGTLAVSRRALEALDLGHELDKTLSDDSTIGDLAAAHGLRVLTRRALLVASPLSVDLSSAWLFGRRQYQIIRIYRPQLWALAATVMSLQLAGWSMVLSELANSSTAQAVLAVLIVLALAKQVLITMIGARLGFSDSVATRTAQTALALAKPLVDAFHLSMILAAGRARSVRWAHVQYEVRGPHDIVIKFRKPWPDSRP